MTFKASPPSWESSDRVKHKIREKGFLASFAENTVSVSGETQSSREEATFKYVSSGLPKVIGEIEEERS